MKRYEEKAPKIVKHVLNGIHNFAKTFGIITAENPMGIKLLPKENKDRNKELFEHLKHGRYQFVKIKGKYGNVENPVLIINIPLIELKELADIYKQESVIYGEILGYKKVNFEYWGRISETTPLKKLDSVDYIKSINSAKDFYSSIKNWKFTIPFPIFQEAIEVWYIEKISLLSEDKKETIKEYIQKIVENDPTYTKHHFYKIRGNINLIINKEKS